MDNILLPIGVGVGALVIGGVVGYALGVPSKKEAEKLDLEIALFKAQLEMLPAAQKALNQTAEAVNNATKNMSAN